MTTRGASVLIGLSLYVGLVLILYGLHRLAFSGGGGPYPLWYSTAELLVKALIAVGPGILAGWFCRGGGLSAGAIVGVVGGLVEAILLSAWTGAPFGEFATRITVAAIAMAIGSAITNAAGGIAGETLRARIKPSNLSLNTEPLKRPG